MPFTSETARHAFHRKAGLAAAKVSRANGFASLAKARQVLQAMRVHATAEREKSELAELAAKYGLHVLHNCNETKATSLHCIHCNER